MTCQIPHSFYDIQKVTWREKDIARSRVSRTSSIISDPESQLSAASSQYNAEQSDLSEDADVFDNDKQFMTTNSSSSVSVSIQHNQHHYKKHSSAPSRNQNQIPANSNNATTGVQSPPPPPPSPSLLAGSPIPIVKTVKSHVCKSPKASRSKSPTLSHLSSCKYL